MAEPDTQPEPSDPFFQILHDSEWNACVGEQGDEVNYVDGYMEAARELVAAVIDKNLVASRDTLAMPILYNCRHALELALKFAIKRLHRAGILAALHPVNHDILSHWQHLDQARIGDATLAGILADIKPFVVSLAAIDDDGQELRYAHARDGAKSLGGVPLVNLRLVRRSIALLSDLLDRLKYRIFDIERERATTTHTKECSRADLEEIAKVLGEHSSWSEDSFKENRQAVMDRFHLGSRKFSEAVNAIRKSRPLAARVGIESNLTYLIDEKAVAALELWSKAHPIQQGAPVSLGMDYFNRDWDAFEKELRLSRELDEAIEGLLSVEELSDLETLFYIGRDHIYGEHYESMLAGKIAEHRVAPRRRERVHHIMSKTNLLDAVVAGAKASGRPSLAMKIRNIRPVA